jgi:hypothetical protein
MGVFMQVIRLLLDILLAGTVGLRFHAIFRFCEYSTDIGWLNDG